MSQDRWSVNTDAEYDAEDEFDALLGRAGIIIPPDRRRGTIATCRDLKRMAALLRQPRSAESEPAAVYRLNHVLCKESLPE